MSDGGEPVRCWNGMTEQEIWTIMEHRIEQWLLTVRVRAEARRAYQRSRVPVVPQTPPPDLLRVAGTKQDRRSSPEVRAGRRIAMRRYWDDRHAREEQQRLAIERHSRGESA